MDRGDPAVSSPASYAFTPFHPDPAHWSLPAVLERAATAHANRIFLTTPDQALAMRLYRFRLSRLISPREVTDAVIAAIEHGRLSFRLPRRVGFSSYLVDAPRALSGWLARDLRRGKKVPA
jgi:hypothetical protein